MTARNLGWALAGAFMALALVAINRGELLAALIFVLVSCLFRSAAEKSP